MDGTDLPKPVGVLNFRISGMSEMQVGSRFNAEPIQEIEMEGMQFRKSERVLIRTVERTGRVAW